MKNTARVVLKALFIIVLFTGTTISLSNFGVKTVNEAKAAVSYATVYKYLVSNGYEVVTLEPVLRNENWFAHTVKQGIHYWTTVYVSGTEIVGHTDVPM